MALRRELRVQGRGVSDDVHDRRGVRAGLELRGRRVRREDGLVVEWCRRRERVGGVERSRWSRGFLEQRGRVEWTWRRIGGVEWTWRRQRGSGQRWRGRRKLLEVRREPGRVDAVVGRLRGGSGPRGSVRGASSASRGVVPTPVRSASASALRGRRVRAFGALERRAGAGFCSHKV
jgi:hypothetical protein